MTAFATKFPLQTFTSSLKGLRLPDRTKLAGEYVLGGTQAESVKNRANSTLPLTVQGTPTYNANSVIVRSDVSTGFGFLTGITPAVDSTLIVIRKNATVASQPIIVGTTPTANTFGMLQFGANNFGANGETLYGLGARRTRPASASTIYFEALVMSAQNPQLVTGGFGKLYYYSGATQVEVVSTDLNTFQRRLTGPLYIGTTFLNDSISTNNLEVYFVALYQRPLSASEINTAYTALVAYYAALGITVV